LNVPYKGGAPTMQALMAGEIEFTVLPPAGVASWVADKRVRVLATAGRARLRSMPDVPTTTELGYTDTAVVFMYALSGPAKLPSDIANLIARDVAAVVKDKDFFACN